MRKYARREHRAKMEMLTIMSSCDRSSSKGGKGKKSTTFSRGGGLAVCPKNMDGRVRGK